MSQDLAQKYRQQQILGASPAQQIVMLYDGAIAHCQKAKLAIAEGRIQDRHNANRRTMEIVGYLLDILDLEKGGDVAKRLYVIYNGLLRRLMDVDFKNDPRICDEVADNLKVLRDSWAEVARQGTAPAQAPGQGAGGPASDPVKKLEPGEAPRMSVNAVA